MSIDEIISLYRRCEAYMRKHAPQNIDEDCMARLHAYIRQLKQ